MKLKMRCVWFAFCLTAVSCKSGGAEGKYPFTGELDPQVEKLLGGKDIYADALRVVPVIVDAEPGSGKNKEHLESYAIIQKGKLLTPEQTRRLQNVIFNAGTYEFNVAKRCMFEPHVGFIFEKAGREAHALFCFSCYEVSFGRDGNRGNLEDFDNARAEIISLSREIFPNDATLKRLNEAK